MVVWRTTLRDEGSPPLPEAAVIPATRNRHPASRVKAVLIALDLAVVAAAFLVGLRLHRGELMASVVTDHQVTAVVVLVIWSFCLVRAGAYASRRVMSRAQEFHVLLRAVGAAALLSVFVAYLSDLDIARPTVLYALPVALVLLAVEREFVRRWFLRRRRSGGLTRKVIIVGANHDGRALATNFAENPALGYRAMGFVDDVVDDAGDLECLGPVDDVVEIARAHGANGVVITETALGRARCTLLCRELIDAGLYVEMIAGVQGFAPERFVPRPLGFAPVLALEPPHHLGWRSIAKRAFDLSLASIGLVLALPLLALAAVAIRIESPGAAIFRQTRVGRDGTRFTLYKLRSMELGAEEHVADLRSHNDAPEPLFKLHADPRVTKVGRVLRRLSIDELPQLVNVLRGEMSLVGPRPALPDEVAQWDSSLYHRLRVRPGITGMWQVAGRSDVSFEEYARLDLYYVDNWSLVTDLSIMLRTVPVLLRTNGAY